MGESAETGRSWTMLLASVAISSVALGTGFRWGMEGQILRTFAAAFAAAGGYMMAHRYATGVFVDGGSGPTDIPRHPMQWAAMAAGGAVLVTGVVLTALGNRSGNVLVGSAGGFLFLTGYMAAHRAATGELL